MSDTNLPPNIEGAISNAAGRFGDLSNEIGQQVKLTRAFNKQLGGFVDNLKNANDVFGNIKDPLEALRKSINALNKTMIASTKVAYTSLKFAPSDPRGKYLRDIINDLGVPADPPGGGGGGGGGGQQKSNVIFDKLIKATEYLNDVMRDNTESLKNIIKSNVSFFNVGNNIVKSFREFENLQIKSLGMGVDYNRFLEANTEVLENARVGQAQLREVMVSNFAAGIKGNSKELKNLNEEMIATGQDTRGLEAVNANLLALTGKNMSVVSNLSRINKQVSDDYQISNDRLVRTMQSLNENLEQASFFGPQAVESLGALGLELQGILGVDMPREINTVLSLIQPSVENMGKQALLGLQGVPEAVVNGTPQISDLNEMFRRVFEARDKARASDIKSANQVVADQFQVSQATLRAILRVGEGVLNGNIAQTRIEKQQEDEFKTVQNLRNKQLDFFTNAGPGLYKVAQEHTQILNAIALGLNVASVGSPFINAIGGFAGKGMAGKFGAKNIAKRFAGGGLASLAVAGGLAAAGQDVQMGSLVGGTAGAAIGQALIPIPVVGALIGGYVGEAIGSSFDPKPAEETAENTEALREAAEAERLEAERRRREQEAANVRANTTLENLSIYLERVAGVRQTRDQDTLQAMQQMITELRLLRLRTTSGGAARPPE